MKVNYLYNFNSYTLTSPKNETEIPATTQTILPVIHSSSGISTCTSNSASRALCQVVNQDQVLQPPTFLQEPYEQQHGAKNR